MGYLELGYPQLEKLLLWYFAGSVLDCDGSATVIARINFAYGEVELPFRDGTAVLSFGEALKCLKPATAETRKGVEW